MEVFLTFRADKTLLALAARLIDLSQQLIQKETQLMSTLQEDIEAIAAQTRSTF